MAVPWRAWASANGRRTSALESVAPQGRVLVVSHGRIIEAGVVTCLPDVDFPVWGLPCQHGQGLRLTYARERFTKVQFLRLR